MVYEQRNLSIRAFQWGHDPEVMVRYDFRRNQRRGSKFQWGHDPEVMVSPMTRRAGFIAKLCFNGATTRRSW